MTEDRRVTWRVTAQQIHGDRLWQEAEELARAVQAGIDAAETGAKWRADWSNRKAREQQLTAHLDAIFRHLHEVESRVAASIEEVIRSRPD